MNAYLWITLAASVICLAALLSHFVRLVRLGVPSDFSVPAGDSRKAVLYSFTGAMSPGKKESAYLHLPTYVAGIIYHLGTFLAFSCIPFIIRTGTLPHVLSVFFTGILLVSSACGIGVAVKRIVKKALRHLSNPDDYLSNLLVTVFQLTTAGVLANVAPLPWYYIILSALLLYIPMGKLKHLLYFFAARIHLAYFFGRRGIWPPVKGPEGSL
jgi:hypothetical protein